MTDAVKRARDLLAKRTPGKWTADIDCFDRHDGIQAIVTDPSTTMMFSCDTGVHLHWGDGETWSDADSAKRDWNWNQAKESQAAHDAALIAAAPDLLRELCEEVERLRGIVVVAQAATFSFEETVRAASDAAARRGNGGQQVSFHGDFCSAPPSVLARLEWWVRHFKKHVTQGGEP